MASLIEIAKEKGIDLPTSKTKLKNGDLKKENFGRRRGWMEQELLKSPSKIEGQTEHNRTQLNTTLNTTEHHTKHNRTQKLNTTEHNRTHKLNTTEHKLNTTLNTTEHNQTQETKHYTEHNRTQLNTILNTTKHHTEHKINDLYVKSDLLGLSGNRKKVIFGLCSYCTNNLTDKVSDISYLALSDLLKVNTRSIKTTIHRLKKQGFIFVISPRGGRGSTIEISVNKIMLKDYAKYIHRETEHKLNTTLNTNAPSSSSRDLIKKTTTTTSPLESDWLKIELPGVLKENRISESIIFQCRDRSLIESSRLQESLNIFAFDISVNKILEKKNIQNPQAWLMSSLTKNGEYAPPLNYVSDEEKAEKEMLERLEARDKAKSERKAQIVELKFKEWAEGLSQAEKNEIKPAMAKNTYGPMFEATLKNHFLNNVFQES